MSMPTVRRQGEWVPLTKAEFRERFFARFYDPAFEAVAPELERVFEKAWDGYGVTYRKSPRTEPAGPEAADPTMAVPVEWLRTKAAIAAAERRQKDRVVADPHPARERLDAQPAHLPGRDLQDAASRPARAAGVRVAARASRSTSSTSRRWPTSRSR